MKSNRFSGNKPAWKTAALILAPMVVLLVADRLIAPHYRLAFNESESLPGTLFVVKAGQLPVCGTETGEHAQFQMDKGARWYTGERMLKVAKGCPGDVIKIVDRKIFINDWFAGEAVPALEDGTPMEMIREGVIPEGHYYMWASHPSSFDSRYAEFSYVSASQVIGKASRVF